MCDHPPGGLADRQLTAAVKRQNERKLPQKEEAAVVINFSPSGQKRIHCQKVPGPDDDLRFMEAKWITFSIR